MPDDAPIQGELQAQIMATLWRLDAGTVEQVRSGLPPRYQGAYTTVQTVLNRLAGRGLLSREREGRGLVYRPRITEAEYLSRAIRRTLAGASTDARQAALADLVGGIDAQELARLQSRAKKVGEARKKRRA